MRLVRRKTLALVTTALTAYVSQPAFAQTTAEDIIVTARRTEERLQDVPISITVYTQEALANRNIFNAADLGTYTPSLSSNSQYGPDKASFVIRGFVQDFGTAPSVGVYFADVVAPQAAGSTPGGNGAGIGNMFDLQNVQVLKGPQGTLFGRNTTGGAILLVPQKPTGQLDGYVEGSAGNFDMWRGQAVLNLPLAETFKVRLGIDRMKRAGYLKNHSGVGPEDFADVDYTSARLSVLADITPDLENYTVATYTRSHTNGSLRRMQACMTPSQVMNQQQGIGLFYGCAQIARQNARGDGFWDVENSHPNPELLQQQWQVINTTTWRASDTLTVKNIASYGEYQERLRQAFGGDNFLNPVTGSPKPDLVYVWFDVSPGRHGASESTFTEELQILGDSLDGRLNWQAGGYLEISDPLGTSGTTSPIFLNCPNHYALQCAGQGNIRDTYDKFWFRSYALYAQGTYKLSEQLSLTAGARYTWDSSRQTNSTLAIAFPTPFVPLYTCANTARATNPDGSPIVLSSRDPARCLLEFKTKSNKPTWLVNLEYKPNQSMLFYAKWARGYRKGGVAILNPFFETWKPEEVDLYELGAKLGFSGAVSGYFNVAGFYNDFSNQQIQASIQSANPARFVGGSAVLNAGKSRIWGIEADASVALFEGLRLDAGYAYLNTQLQQLTVPSIPPEARSLVAALIPSATVGSELSYSPKHRLTASVNYTLPLDDSIGKITFGGTYTYTSRQVATAATAPQFIPLSSRSLLNLNASWNDLLGQPVDLSFFMTNVTNKKYVLSVSQTWNTLGFESVVPNEPRMWGFRLKYRFGD
jgi:iron complex outermembrane receptor protein